MPRGDNCDVRFVVGAQRPDDNKATWPEAVKGDRAQLEAGYATLDQASTDPYGPKERRGLTRDANYPRRY